MHPCILRHKQKWIALLVALTLAVRVSAAVSEGPLLTNAAAAEARRQTQFYRAEQSYQEKLQVGQKRYEEKQAIRAQAIAAMAAELADRQQTLVIAPVETSSLSARESAPVSRTWLVVAVLAAVFAGLGYYWSRHRPQEAFPHRSQDVLRKR